MYFRKSVLQLEHACQPAFITITSRFHDVPEHTTHLSLRNTFMACIFLKLPLLCGILLDWQAKMCFWSATSKPSQFGWTVARNGDIMPHVSGHWCLKVPSNCMRTMVTKGVLKKMHFWLFERNATLNDGHLILFLANHFTKPG